MVSKRNSQSRNAHSKNDRRSGQITPASNSEMKGRRSRTDGSNSAYIQGQLNRFVESLSDVLLDITALEVNTMVVERITGDKFIPWDAYRGLYPIDRAYLEQYPIHESLRDRYLELRRTLELNYALCLSDPRSELYDPVKIASPESNRVLSDPALEINERNTQLPSPFKRTSADELLEVQQILADARFLRGLRKLGELKASLDNRNQTLLKMDAAYPGNSPAVIAKAVKTDTIYAQTVIQLDGDTINRYSEVVVDHPHKDLMLKIHQESVAASERQWRGLLGFAIDIVRKALDRGHRMRPPTSRR
ncbi:MAG: hypothetical protein SVX43_02870 [Cyanobacteriota bacterium]|nr:hypothetical protein [Cyanobacteriota bacterium]